MYAEKEKTTYIVHSRAFCCISYIFHTNLDLKYACAYRKSDTHFYPLDMWVYETNGFIAFEMLDSFVIIA